MITINEIKLIDNIIDTYVIDETDEISRLHKKLNLMIKHDEIASECQEKLKEIRKELDSLEVK